MGKSISDTEIVVPPFGHYEYFHQTPEHFLRVTLGQHEFEGGLAPICWLTETFLLGLFLVFLQNLSHHAFPLKQNNILLKQLVKMKIAAFNVKRLGWTKVNKKAVREIIIEILSEYSVVVLLEVMDESGKAMKLLLKHLNNYGDNRSNPYGMLCSEPLGRTAYKEKFVYFYRKKEVKIEDSYQYVENDEDNEYDEDDEDEEDVDELAREPFAVLLKCPSTVVQNLVLIPVHTKPSDAEAELNALHEVVEDVRERWQNDNIMILGDFNADGQYLSMRKKDSILISSAPYYWLIDDDVDTTTSNNNDHTYDRIVVSGERMLKAIVPDSAIAYNFEEELNLTEEETQSVSDHYPVEVELKQKALRKRNPGTTGAAQKKKPGPAAKKRRGA